MTSELTQAIAQEILALPALGGADWDTYSLVGEVGDDRVAITGYRYPESGPAIPTPIPMIYDLLGELRAATRGPDGAAWDVVLVKIRRGSGDLAMDFVSGDAADAWRVTPANLDRLPEALRPRPEDFAPAP